jgi:hypothetical protein
MSKAASASSRIAFPLIAWLGGAVHTAHLPGMNFWDGAIWLYYVGRKLAIISIGSLLMSLYVSSTTPAIAEENTATEIAKTIVDSKVANSLGEIMQSIEKAVETHAPEAVQVMLSAIRFKGAMVLLTGLFFLCSILPIYKISRAWWTYCEKRFTELQLRRGASEAEHLEIGQAAAWILGVVSSAICLLVSLLCLLSPQAWASVIDPRLGLAYALLNKFIQ